MKKHVNRSIIFLLIGYWGLVVPKSVAQTIEQAYGLRFKADAGYFQNSLPYGFIIDSTQVTHDGFHPLRLLYNNVLTLKTGDGRVFTEKRTETCNLFSSRTVVLPANAKKKDCCTVTLNYKSEIEGLQFIVIARDIKENTVYTNSVSLPASDQWTNRSFTFCKAEARAVSIILNREGCDEEYQGRSIYLNNVSIRIGDRELNPLPLTSLVHNNIQLKKKAIIPLSIENNASLAKIQDWKDKKIIALGESSDRIREIRDVQVQLMKQLITTENCRLILLELPQNQCFRWNLYLQGKRPESYGDMLMKELKGSVYSASVFYEMLQWVRRYNAKATDPVRIIGINDAQGGGGWNYLVAYLVEYSTNRQDSIYYLKALKQGIMYSKIKEHIVQSPLSGFMSKKDFQYLLFLLEEMEAMKKRPYATSGSLLSVVPEYSLDRAKRVERVIDMYLSPSEKAVILAYSGRINKHFPIYDTEVKFWNQTSDSLGGYLYQRYGKQYHAVSIQIGERTCLADTSTNKKNNIPKIYPVNWKPPFPFAFEQAAMDCGIPYFYYPSNQLPNTILGLNLFSKTIDDDIPFCYCHIPSQFDALVFIREAKSNIEDLIYSKIVYNYREYPFDTNKLLKELGE